MNQFPDEDTPDADSASNDKTPRPTVRRSRRRLYETPDSDAGAADKSAAAASASADAPDTSSGATDAQKPVRRSRSKAAAKPGGARTAGAAHTSKVAESTADTSAPESADTSADNPASGSPASETEPKPAGAKTPRKKSASPKTRASSPSAKQKAQKEASKAAEAVPASEVSAAKAPAAKATTAKTRAAKSKTTGQKISGTAAKTSAKTAAEAESKSAAAEREIPVVEAKIVAESAAESEAKKSTSTGTKSSARSKQAKAAAGAQSASSTSDTATEANQQTKDGNAQSKATTAESKTGEAQNNTSAGAEKEIPVTEATMVPLTPEEERARLREAMKVVKRFSLYSAGTGLVPIPWLDIAALTVVQVKMLRRLTEKYNLRFSENDGKAYVGALLSSITATTLGLGAASTGLMLFSGVGRLLGFLTMPAFGAAFTYAVGKIFIYHFESGGSFFSFDPEKMKIHFREVYAEAGTVSERWKREASDAEKQEAQAT